MPAPQRDAGPDRLDHAERPGALQEAVDSGQRVGGGEAQRPPGRAILEEIADQAGGDREQTEGGEGGQPLAFTGATPSA